MRKAVVQKFTVAIAYTGECCQGSHILLTTVSQTDERKAEALVRRRLKRQGFTPGDAAVLRPDGLQAYRRADQKARRGRSSIRAK